MSRFKNYGLWVSIFALVPLVAQVFGFSLPENYQDIINGVLAVLVTAGILSNPQTDNKGYLDDSKIEG